MVSYTNSQKYSHLSLKVANQGAAMGFNDRLEGCVVEVADLIEPN